jgi:hypothetical protein
MKTHNVRYIKGHLVDSASGKRVFLKRGGNFTILGDDDQFELKDEMSFDFQPLPAPGKLERLRIKHRNFVLVRLAFAGTRFIYRIGLSRTTSEERAPEFLFDAVLLEDLYMMSKNGEDWTLCNCYCETTECLDGEVQMIEPVQGYSLNNLFSNMVAFYFPMQRSGTVNAFNDFFLPKQWSDELLYMVKSQKLPYLGAYRDTFQKLVYEYKEAGNNIRSLSMLSDFLENYLRSLKDVAPRIWVATWHVPPGV